MMFQLEDGGHTRVFFYKDVDGKVHPFPSDNANIVLTQGTEASKEILNRILGRKNDDISLINHYQFFRV